MKSPETVPSPPFTNTLLVRPQHLNHAGTLFGGTIMAWADELAFIAATLTYPHCTFVTKVFHEFNFLAGAAEGDIVTIAAQVLKTGHTSVTVAVRGENSITGQQLFHTDTVMVNARDGHRLPIRRNTAPDQTPATGTSETKIE